MSDIEAARKAMQERITSGEPFTFLHIYSLGNLAGGWRAGDQRSPVYRLADRMIQFERRHRRIHFRNKLWYPKEPQP